jgi:predicted nucleic acid-binding protein
MDLTIRIARVEDLLAIVRLAAAFRDHLGQSTPSETVYDALTVTLSVREQGRYVTADERLVNAIGAVFPTVLGVVHWP